MTNDELYEKALLALQNLFSDTSVSQADTANNLRSLRDELDALLDTLEEAEKS